MCPQPAIAKPRRSVWIVPFFLEGLRKAGYQHFGRLGAVGVYTELKRYYFRVRE